MGGGIKDVAWCPNLCRPYELLVTCGAGASLWRLDFPSLSDDYRGGPSAAAGAGSAGYRGKQKNQHCQLQRLTELIPAAHDACPIWRCHWNLTGTTLALCPEAGEVSLWKTDASQEWREVVGDVND